MREYRITAKTVKDINKIILDELLPDLKTGVKKKIRQHAYDTGNLHRSIDKNEEQTDDSITVGTDVPYVRKLLKAAVIFSKRTLVGVLDKHFN